MIIDDDCILYSRDHNYQFTKFLLKGDEIVMFFSVEFKKPIKYSTPSKLDLSSLDFLHSQIIPIYNESIK